MKKPLIRSSALVLVALAPTAFAAEGSAGYFNPCFGLSLNWDRRQAEAGGLEADIDTIALGGEFRF